MPPRLVRRETLSERISTAINPLDQEMAFSTWLGGIDWDGFQNSLATPMGLVLNLTYFIARANSDGTGRRRGADDVLRRSTIDRMDGWGAAISYSVCVSSFGGDDMFACRPLHNQFYDDDESLLFYYLGVQLWFLSWALVVGSLVNTFYCFTKKRRYRLFENNIEVIARFPPLHAARSLTYSLSSSRKPPPPVESASTPLPATLPYVSSATSSSPSSTAPMPVRTRPPRETSGKLPCGIRLLSPYVSLRYSPPPMSSSISSPSQLPPLLPTTIRSPATPPHHPPTRTQQSSQSS